jgi:CopG family nickel-responsive transcriptional regulator
VLRIRVAYYQEVGMPKLVRFGVSMEAELLERFDQWTSRHDWANRSEAIRDLVRDRLVQDEWRAGAEPVVASLTFVYDHHVSDLQERLTRLQHDHHGLVLSAMHVHLDHEHCMEVLVMRGSAAALQSLADRILGSRGVKHGQLARTTLGNRL